MIVKSEDFSAMNHKPTIAPKSQTISTQGIVSSSTAPSGRLSNSCRRRIAFHPTLGYAITPTMPAKVARRNARERNRVKQVNCGFELLRSHIPSAAKAKKMSKVETLRHAVEYIQTMQRMLYEQQQHHHHMQHDIRGTTELPAPLHIQSPPTPLTPTPSSRASLAPSPMTPHVPPQQHQQPQFILPEASAYQTPLTPRTPNTPNFSNGHNFSSNDSGYEATSYYSSPSEMLSPGPQGMSSNHHTYNEMMTPGGGIRQPMEVSPVSPRPMQFHEMELTGGFQYNYNVAVNPEEEELLDVIAKWQEQDE